MGTDALLLIIIAALMVPAVAQFIRKDPNPQAVKSQNGVVTIDTTGLKEGFYKYYYEKAGKSMSFL